jgi:DNA-directed RNA polymerase specialized sigma24 family protein
MAMKTHEWLDVDERSTDAELDSLASSTFLLALDPTRALSWLLREEEEGNPILSLGCRARFAFVSHHVLGYKIQDAAAFADLSEEQFQSLLRNAYFQLAASCEFHAADSLAEPALA